MNGPEHYAEAERLIRHVATDPGIREDEDLTLARSILETAQVHATLALAAATAMAAAPTHPGEAVGMVPNDFIAWREVAGANDEAVTS